VAEADTLLPPAAAVAEAEEVVDMAGGSFKTKRGGKTIVVKQSEVVIVRRTGEQEDRWGL